MSVLKQYNRLIVFKGVRNESPLKNNGVFCTENGTWLIINKLWRCNSQIAILCNKKLKKRYWPWPLTLWQVLDFVRLTVQARKVNLMSVDLNQGNSQFIQIPIDSKLQEFTVSLSGASPELRLYNPNGESIMSLNSSGSRYFIGGRSKRGKLFTSKIKNS